MPLRWRGQRAARNSHALSWVSLERRKESYANVIQGAGMKPSTTNQIKGKLREMKGKAKEAVGRKQRDPDLEDEGTAEKVSGTVQKKVGQIQKVFEK